MTEEPLATKPEPWAYEELRAERQALNVTVGKADAAAVHAHEAAAWMEQQARPEVGGFVCLVACELLIVLVLVLLLAGV